VSNAERLPRWPLFLIAAPAAVAVWNGGKAHRVQEVNELFPLNVNAEWPEPQDRLLPAIFLLSARSGS
jgi:hypothetical protein